MVNYSGTDFETKLLQFLALIVEELHEHNKTQKQILTVTKQFNSKFDDEQFKLTEIIDENIPHVSSIEKELKELNKPIGE